MSTKTTRKYVNTEIFSLHLYDDFANGPGLDITLNGANAHLDLTSDEIDKIEKQLSDEWDND